MQIIARICSCKVRTLSLRLVVASMKQMQFELVVEVASMFLKEETPNTSVSTLKDSRNSVRHSRTLRDAQVPWEHRLSTRPAEKESLEIASGSEWQLELPI